MNYKKFLSLKHHHLSPHHHYQMTVIFVFIFGFFLLWPYYELVNEYRFDMQTWQWYFFWPWMGYYTFYCLKQRAKIPKSEERNPLKRPLFHWILLGLTMIFIHLQPTTLENLQSLDISFAIFSIFVADSYWDFKKIRLFG